MQLVDRCVNPARSPFQGQHKGPAAPRPSAINWATLRLQDQRGYGVSVRFWRLRCFAARRRSIHRSISPKKATVDIWAPATRFGCSSSGGSSRMTGFFSTMKRRSGASCLSIARFPSCSMRSCRTPRLTLPEVSTDRTIVVETGLPRHCSARRSGLPAAPAPGGHQVRSAHQPAGPPRSCSRALGSRSRLGHWLYCGSGAGRQPN